MQGWTPPLAVPAAALPEPPLPPLIPEVLLPVEEPAAPLDVPDAPAAAPDELPEIAVPLPALLPELPLPLLFDELLVHP